MLGIVVHLSQQHDAAAADGVPHLDDQLLQRAARAGVARDRDRLIALEHLSDERMGRLLVLPVHVAQRDAVLAGALGRLGAGGDGDTQGANKDSREQAAHQRSGLAGRPFCSRIRLTKRVKR